MLTKNEVLQNIITTLNKHVDIYLAKTNDENITTNDIKDDDKELSDIFNIIVELEPYLTESELEALKQTTLQNNENLTQLIQLVQNKLDNDEFVGEQGISKDSYKNLFINPCFRVNQREFNNSTISSTTYLVDRFVFDSGGESVEVGKGYDYNLNSYYLMFSNNSNGYSTLTQFIESKVLTNGVYTLSFYTKSDIAYSLRITIGNTYNNGWNPIYSNYSYQVISDDYVRVILTFTIDTDTLQNMDNSHFFNVVIGCDDTSYPNAKIYICKPQLEIGSVVTDFEYRPIQIEEILCKRFYETFKNLRYGDYTSTILDRFYSLTYQSKRLTPSITINSSDSYTLFSLDNKSVCFNFSNIANVIDINKITIDAEFV